MLHEIQGSFSGPGYSGYGTAYAQRYDAKYISRDFTNAVYNEGLWFTEHKINPVDREPFLAYTLSNTVMNLDVSVIIPIAAEFVNCFLQQFPQYELRTFTHVDGTSTTHLERVVTVCFAAKKEPQKLEAISPADLAAMKAEIKEKIYLELRKEITSTVYDLVSEI